MALIVATFGQPEDITRPGDDGKVFRHPLELIDRDDIGTPRHSSKTKKVRITAKISDTLRTTWPPNEPDLVKAMFELAKEHLIHELKSGVWKGNDLEVIAHQRPCPYDLNLIEEPTGAVIEIDIQRRIGF